MNKASTSFSMELISGAYNKNILCDGNSLVVMITRILRQYSNTNSTNTGVDDDFADKRNTLVIGSGKLEITEEYLVTDDGSCGGLVSLTLKKEENIFDNGSKKFVSLNSGNISASIFELDLQFVKLSLNHLGYINGIKPDKQTYLWGKFYWTGIESDIT